MNRSMASPPADQATAPGAAATPALPVTTSRARHRWPGLLSLAAALALAGCSTLQIDVDVYKGPLVHDRSTQLQQLSSVAMAAKAMMQNERNRLLDDVASDWSATDTGLRGRHLGPLFWRQRAASTPACAPQPATVDATLRRQSAKCALALTLDNILSAYEDRTPEAFASALAALDARHAESTRQVAALLEPTKVMRSDSTGDRAAPALGQSGGRPDPGRTAMPAPTADDAWRVADEALRQTWLATVDLLMLAQEAAWHADQVRPAGASTGPRQDRAAEQAVRLTAQLLAQLTEPGLLIAAVKGGRAGFSEEARQAILAAESELVSSRNLRAADVAMEALLLRARTHDLAALRTLGELHALDERTAHTAGIPLRKPLPPTADRPGIHTAPPRTGKTTDDRDDLVNRLMSSLMRLGASGFDHGRPIWGIDTLADRVAHQHFGQHARTRQGQAESSDSGAADPASRGPEPSREQLHDSIADLASRLQFLAVNLSRYEEYQGQEGPRFKATLEVVANTLLVLTEDHRRQAQHEARQRSGGAAERDAAAAHLAQATRPTVDGLLHWLDAQHRQRQQAETRASASAPAAPAATAASTPAPPASAPAPAPTEQLAALALTWLGPAPAGHALHLGTPWEAEPATAWRRDSQALMDRLRKLPDNTTRAQLFNETQAWFDDELTHALSTPLAKASARGRRLQAARDGLGTQLATASTQPVKRSTAMDEWTALLRLVRGSAPPAAAPAALARPPAELTVSLNARSGDGHPAPPPSPAADELLAVRQRIATARADMAALIEHLQALPPDQRQAEAERRLATGTTAPGDRAGQEAARLVTAWLAQQGAGALPGADQRFRAGPDAAKPTTDQVLDQVEAWLSHQRIAHLQAGGGDKATQVAEALSALTARRERLQYVRPASTYLRSALAATSQQENPALDWRNMLSDTIKRVIENRDTSTAGATAHTRAELDKAFWQNVNQVRVSGAGATNYAIAKDDLGNWYVRAMGADGAAMVKAARDLALYNLGSRLNTDLLRLNDLREKPERTEAETLELDRLTQRSAAPGAAAYGQTLTVFRQHHDTVLQGLLDGLHGPVMADELRTALADRWAATQRRLAPAEPAQGAAAPPLKGLLTTSDADALLARARQAVAPPPTTAAPAPAARLVDALSALRELAVLVRRQLRAQFQPALAEAEASRRHHLSARAAAAAQVAARAQVLAERQAELQALEAARADTALPPSASATERTRQDEARAALDDARTRAKDAATALQQAAQALKDHEARVAQAHARLGHHQALRDALLADVDQVLGTAVRTVGQKQLSALTQLETAAGVVTQGLKAPPLR